MKHSVILEYKRCRGCTTCIKNCPTEAVRVRSGKATILNERCIDCGKCIQVCPHKAVKSVSDSLDKLEQYKYRVALPDPALYGQFQHLDDIDIVLNGLLEKLHLSDLDAGDILLLILLFFLFRQEADEELLIAIGLLLIL